MTISVTKNFFCDIICHFFCFSLQSERMEEMKKVNNILLSNNIGGTTIYFNH